MGKLFDLDSPIMSTLNKLADLVVLNIVYLICCIPIFTIGAATTSLYYVTMKMVEDRGSSTLRGFFHSFRQNFKQGTGIWFLFALISVVLGIDFYILHITANPSLNIVRLLLAIPVVILAFTLTYVFPLLARFENTVRQTIKNAFLLSISNLPKTILMLVLNAIPYVILILSVRLIPISLIVGFAGIAYVNSAFLIKIFKRFEPAEEETRMDQMEREIIGEKKKGIGGKDRR